MARKRVLIVDDEPDVVRVMKLALHSEGFECLAAEDGAAGVALAQQEIPDLILLDIMLPKGSGYKVIRELKADGVCRHIPVVMLSAMADGEDARVGKLLGAVEYVAKPFDLDKLVALVKRILGEGTSVPCRVQVDGI